MFFFWAAEWIRQFPASSEKLTRPSKLYVFEERRCAAELLGLLPLATSVLLNLYLNTWSTRRFTFTSAFRHATCAELTVVTYSILCTRNTRRRTPFVCFVCCASNSFARASSRVQTYVQSANVLLLQSHRIASRLMSHIQYELLWLALAGAPACRRSQAKSAPLLCRIKLISQVLSAYRAARNEHKIVSIRFQSFSNLSYNPSKIIRSRNNFI